LIGALRDVIIEGIQNPDPKSIPNGPTSVFSSEAKLITALTKNYDGYYGLSKRNLERIFSDAKRSLTDF
jgi:hypothetical protein